MKTTVIEIVTRIAVSHEATTTPAELVTFAKTQAEAALATTFPVGLHAPKNITLLEDSTKVSLLK